MPGNAERTVKVAVRGDDEPELHEIVQLKIGGVTVETAWRTKLRPSPFGPSARQRAPDLRGVPSILTRPSVVAAFQSRSRVMIRNKSGATSSRGDALPPGSPLPAVVVR